jgi:hypothetical protein
MKGFLFVIFFALAVPVMASHIVGGEFEIIHIEGFTYRINMILYFDEIHGAQVIKTQEPIIHPVIFRSSDNATMEMVHLSMVEITDVNYTQSECAVTSLRTSRIVYTTLVTLSPEQYSDPQGYYIAWERCCRNYFIKNIVSENPMVFPGDGAGQTFFLRFPPVTIKGEPFVNSTPTLFPPLSDYACMNQPYYADFAGTDVDGDSLAYSIVTPLSTHTEESTPEILPLPYPLIEWRPGYNLNNILNGSPDLEITQDGLLTVTPRSDTGLFVFAVKVTEFRKGVKIGEVRRDFQMLVQDCKEAVAPKIYAKTTGGSYAEGNLNVHFSHTVPDEERCITVKVSDDDAFRATDGQSEDIGIRVIPIGFKGDITNILPDDFNSTLTPEHPSEEFQICFDHCPIKDGTIQIGIISYDDACALPLLDTVILTLFIEPPPNRDPYFTTPDVNATVQEGEKGVWYIKGYDDDLDTLDVDVTTDDFLFGEKGFFLDSVVHENGLYTAQLRWEAKCDEFDFTDRTDFEIQVTLNDRDECVANDSVTMTLDMHVDLPDFEPPVIATNLSVTELQEGLIRKIPESIDFHVFGVDNDNNPLALEMQGVGFVPSDYGIVFPEVTGNSPVASDFHWQLVCGELDLTVKDQFEFLFIVKDSYDKCGIYRADSVTVLVDVDPPVNTAPMLTMQNLSADLQMVDNSIEMRIGQELNVQLLANDNDSNPADGLKIELINADGNVEPSGYQFIPGEGIGSAAAMFTWAPECSVFENGVYNNQYVFLFRALDDRCLTPLADTVQLNLTIRDVDGDDTEFLPPNVITPNDDGCNDFFAMDDLGASACGEMNFPHLPKDNCQGRFESIRIYNRWGKQVFRSSERNFRWFANSQAGGVYFYTIIYTNAEYKGSVTVTY